MEVLENEAELVDKILEKSDLTKEELEEQIKKKQEEYGGLLTASGAAYSIAKDMDIDLGIKEEKLPVTKISELDSDLGRANVNGVITKISSVRNWEKGDRKGKVASVTIRDSTGETRLSFWNETCDLLGKLSVGKKIALKNVITRKRRGKVELSFGRNSKLSVKELANVPEFKENIVRVKDLEKDLDVNCFLRVVRTFPPNHFKRKDGTEGSVANIIVTDGEETRLVLWDGQSKCVQKINPNDLIKVEGAYVKENNGKKEINLGWNGRLILNPENAPELPKIKARESERTKIKELEEGDNYKEIRAVIVQAYEPTIFSICPKCSKRVDGKCEECGVEAEQRMVFNAELDDGSDVIRGVFFSNMAEQMLGITATDFQEKGYDINELLGIEKIFQGQTKKSQRIERKEFVVRRIKEVDVEKEIKSLKGV